MPLWFFSEVDEAKGKLSASSEFHGLFVEPASFKRISIKNGCLGWSEQQESCRGFPKLGGTFWGVPVIRSIVLWLYIQVPIQGDYHVSCEGIFVQQLPLSRVQLHHATVSTNKSAIASRCFVQLQAF